MQPNTVLTRIRQANELKASKALEDRKHQEDQLAAIQTQEIILKSFKSLIAYLDSPERVSKTAVVNQLKEIGTPDALNVVEAVNELHSTLKTHKNTDLSEVASLLKGVLAEAKQIPKTQQEIVIPSEMSVSNLPDHKDDFKKLLDAVKAIKLVAEAPVVNVPTPEVKVEAPDLSNLTQEIKALKTKQADIKDGALQTQDISGMITDKYDRFEIKYASNDFDDTEEKRVSAIKYYEGRKLVATLTFTYKAGELVGGKKI